MESEATNTVPVWIQQSLTHYHKGFPCGDFLLGGQNISLGMGIYQSDINKAAEDAASEEEGGCLVAEVVGGGE